MQREVGPSASMLVGQLDLKQQAAGSNAVTHHLLPRSVSPAMDLALVFTTTAPSSGSNAPAAAAQANAPNLAGLSAAQRLIQQRMAMMRARAAAAAGKAGPSSQSDGGSGSSTSSPVRGAAIEMTLYRVAAEPDAVWKQSIKFPDVVFPPAEEGKAKQQQQQQHETCRVMGMQYSPDGRRIALHIDLVQVDPTSKETTQAITLVALYSIDDGRLVAITQLPCTLAHGRRPLYTNLSWVRMPCDSAATPRRSYATLRASRRSAAHAISMASNAAVLAGNYASSAAAQGGSGGGPGARFQHLMGGGGGGGGANRSGASASSSTLPSQRALTADAPAKGGYGVDEDLMRGWSDLGDHVSEADEEHKTCLLVPTFDGGIALLLEGRVHFATIPVSLDSSHIHVATSRLTSRGRLQTIAVEAAQDDPSKYRTLAMSLRPRFLSSPRALDAILTLSSILAKSCTQALDLTYLCSAVYKTLRSTGTPPAPSSLSAHQVTSLPPLSRFLYTLACVGGNFSQDVRNHLTLAVCEGTPSDMVETILLNTLVEGKAAGMQSELRNAYEVLEGVASELARLCDAIGGLLVELQGWKGTPYASFFPPDDAANVATHLATLRHLRALTHHIVSYAQGERLAWDEWAKWLQWERTRLEALKTSEQDPMDPATFDPLVVVELIRRGWVSCELDWIIAGERVAAGAVQDADNDADDDGDETEESFQREAKSEVAKEDDGQGKEGGAKEVIPPSEVVVPASHSANPAGRSLVEDTLAWLDDGVPRLTASPPPPSDSRPYHRLFEGGPSNPSMHSVYDFTPHPIADYTRKLVQGIKDVFVGMPERLAGGDDDDDDESGSREFARFSAPPTTTTGRRADAGIASLPAPPASSDGDAAQREFAYIQRTVRAVWHHDDDGGKDDADGATKMRFTFASMDGIVSCDLHDEQGSDRVEEFSDGDANVELLDGQRAIALGKEGAQTPLVLPLSREKRLPLQASHGDDGHSPRIARDVACIAERGVLAVLSRQRSGEGEGEGGSAETPAAAAAGWEKQTLAFWRVGA